MRLGLATGRYFSLTHGRPCSSAYGPAADPACIAPGGSPATLRTSGRQVTSGPTQAPNQEIALPRRFGLFAFGPWKLVVLVCRCRSTDHCFSCARCPIPCRYPRGIGSNAPPDTAFYRTTYP